VQHDSYRNIKLVNESGILWATIDNPPVNLIDEPLILELERLGNEAADLDDVSVLVLKSADPDFFLAHVDVGRIEDEPTTAPPRGSDIGRWHTMCERFRTLPQATIGMVEGRARGGASEILLSLDMIFGAKETATFSQPEVGFGIIPGGGGCVRLPYAVGRGRALEIILGCEDFSADLAERYGWINRALPANELEGFVRGLAQRIASFSREAIALSKTVVDASRDEPIREALLTELWALNSSLATTDARKLLTHYMSEYGQRREHELVLNDVVAEMNRIAR
jgi:enoyl-CoA hydratase/carnithine racemase